MRKKIAIIHPKLMPGGGSEACAVWIAEALKKDNDVTLMAMGRIDLGGLNEYYGTNLAKNEVNLVEIPIPRLFEKRFDALRCYKLARCAKKLAPEFDVMISTYNFMDFGKKGIQLVADLSFDEDLRIAYDPMPSKSNKFFYRRSFMRRIYIKFAQILSGASTNGWKKNITVANSFWTQKILEKKFGIKSIMIYPVVAGNFPNIGWNDRESGFVCLGRISPEKQIEKIIGILEILREYGIKTHLHIIGHAYDQNYFKIIKRLCGKNKDWCFLEGKMYGQKKLNFMAKHKFGISGRPNEPFGIAVAEMVKSGNIVFVPNGGGQTEIAGDEYLVYNNQDDARQKIQTVLENEKLQEELRRSLSANVQKFSKENFINEIKNLITNEF